MGKRKGMDFRKRIETETRYGINYYMEERKVDEKK